MQHVLRQRRSIGFSQVRATRENSFNPKENHKETAEGRKAQKDVKLKLKVNGNDFQNHYKRKIVERGSKDTDALVKTPPATTGALLEPDLMSSPMSCSSPMWGSLSISPSFSG